MFIYHRQDNFCPSCTNMSSGFAADDFTAALKIVGQMMHSLQKCGGALSGIRELLRELVPSRQRYFESNDSTSLMTNKRTNTVPFSK